MHGVVSELQVFGDVMKYSGKKMMKLSISKAVCFDLTEKLIDRIAYDVMLVYSAL